MIDVFTGFVANSIYAENLVSRDDFDDDEDEEEDAKKLLKMFFALFLLLLALLSFALLCNYLLNL